VGRLASSRAPAPDVGQAAPGDGNRTLQYTRAPVAGAMKSQAWPAGRGSPQRVRPARSCNRCAGREHARGTGPLYVDCAWPLPRAPAGLHSPRAAPRPPLSGCSRPRGYVARTAALRLARTLDGEAPADDPAARSLRDTVSRPAGWIDRGGVRGGG